MSNTPEGNVKEEINKVLKSYGSELYSFMPVQRGFGKRGLDYHCTFRGLSFYIEAKAPGKKLTKKQIEATKEMRAAGAPVFEIDHEDSQGMADLKGWLEMVNSYGR